MKPILVLKQQEIMPEVMNMASGAPSAMGSVSPLAFVPLPSTTKDPISGRPLLAPQGAQYRTQYDIRGKETPFSDISAPKSQKQIRAMGHDPKTLAEMSSEELEGFLQNRAAKEAAKQSQQEVLARQMAQSGGNSQAAFEEALRRTGRGALAGKIGAGALAGLTGLMALQRANESGTDLISALGGAGAQGYSTYRYANPTLQSLGMRGAARFSPNISQPTSPSGGNTSLPPTISPGATPTTATPTATPTLPKAGSTGQTTWEDWTPDHGDHGVEMRVAEHGPSDHSSAITNEQENEVINNYQNMDISQNPFHRPTDWRDADTDWDENAPTTAGPTTESERRELEMRNEYHQMFKGNRRSFVGVR